MKKRILFRLAALALSVFLLAGCAAPSASSGLPESVIPYSQMVYSRPDPDALQALSQAVLDKTTPEEAIAALNDFYEGYDRFFTDCALADIRNAADLTDDYWSAENEYCIAVSPEADQISESLMRSLAASDLRIALEQSYLGEGYFRSYDRDAFYTPALMALFQEESRLQSEYYALQDVQLPQNSPLFYNKNADILADILVELIQVRRKIAAECGYENYPAFANDYYFYREYTPEMVERYLSDVRQELLPLYQQYRALSKPEQRCTESKMLAYVEQTADGLGGTVKEAFHLMKEASLYDIAYNRKKYDSSFEVYLYSYREPFLFLNPTGTVLDKLTLTHEFGHFCNDYAVGGSLASIDVMEVFSQGLEYLSLCCGKPDREMIRLKLADGLATYVEQSCYAAFEQKMYLLPENQLNREGLYLLYETTAKAYGLDGEAFDRREFVTITHFYTNPMYILSYIFSNDAAMQFYEMELAKPGTGKARYLSLLATDSDYFLSFLEEAGLVSPFAPGRIQQVRHNLETGIHG